jgi:hypothetical protein
MTDADPAGRPHSGPDRTDLAFAAVATLASLALQFRFPHVIGSDGFFHVRAAERVLDFDGAMPWMPYSVFADGWVDHQLLFHLLIAPLAWLLDGVVAAKTAGALFTAGAAVALLRVLRRQGAPLPHLFAALPFGLSWLLLLRMEMPRAQGLSLALLVLAIGALLERHHKLLFALAFAYAWSYHVSVILVPVAGLFAVVVTLRERAEARAAWTSVAVAAGGLLAGFAIHPHTPRTFRFLWQHVVQKVANREELPVGLEWADGGLAPLFGFEDMACTIAGGGLLALVLAGGLLLQAGPRRTTAAVFVASLAAVATVGVLAGTKFVEYQVPLSALALALAARDAQPPWLRRRATAFVGGLVVAVLLLLSARTVTDRVARTEPHPDELAEAMEFLRGHAEPGELIFHFHWNDFPELVFHAPEFRYVVGLDPHFLYLHDPDRWRLYDAIGGAYGGLRSDAIRDVFGARWAVLRLPHPGARDALAADPGLEPVFDDEAHAVVYRVVDRPTPQSSAER